MFPKLPPVYRGILQQCLIFFGFAFIKSADNGEIFNLLIGKLAVSAVYLRKNITGINKQYFVFVRLGIIKKPQRCRERYACKHIGWQRNHLADYSAVYQFAADCFFTVAGIGRRICHDQSRPPTLIRAVANIFIQR
jgi:hypothetical protein